MKSAADRNKIDVNSEASSEALPDDPSAVQRISSNPKESVWVSASAGTGKTKVLTDRLLRLMLPRPDGAPGTEPHKILCLTFTKAAANEMTLRLFDTLSRWAVMPERALSDPAVENLTDVLERLTGEPPTQDQVRSARRLFAKILDAALGIKIMTIHGFCQSVLSRFPLEADLRPNFDVLEPEQSLELIAKAQTDIFQLATSRDYAGSPLQNAMIALSAELSEDQFISLVSAVSAERFQLSKTLGVKQDAEVVYAEICRFYGVVHGENAQDYLSQSLVFSADREVQLKRVAEVLVKGKDTERQKGQQLLSWLSKRQNERMESSQDYFSVFLTQKGTIATGGFPSIDTKKRLPEAEDILRGEAERALIFFESLKKIKCAALSRDLFTLGQAIVDRYEALKQARGSLDYDDLILKTCDLLSGQTLQFKDLREENPQEAIEVTPWIMYKLDQGIDHILVDEAQDTNPEQWQVISALSDDFFSGKGAQDISRTSFTVGDMKQSIYSFQRAAPEAFSGMRDIFRQKIHDFGQTMLELPLQFSFRSTQPILDAVDAVFARQDLCEALGGDTVHHVSTRTGQAGLVELWPILEQEKNKKLNFWDPPEDVYPGERASTRLAQKVADHIHGWLTHGEVLKSYGRAVQPGDILILFRTRIALADELIRALKQHGVPVSGADRMDLGAQVVVQDLLAVAKFCLLPSDDLNLACLLKSPLIGWGDEELFSLAADRTGDLWSELVHFGSRTYHRLLDDPKGITLENAECVRQYLSKLRYDSMNGGVYRFFMRVLTSVCPAHKTSGMMAILSRLGEDARDPIEEFLNAAINFGKNHMDSLELFVAHFESLHKEIKREMEEAGRQVRIMTVHGAKGLQAPIVILPDTVPTPNSQKVPMLLWPDKTGLNFPLWAPRDDDAPQQYKEKRQILESALDAENNRLLYVAMTRAADRLYVCGFKGSRTAKRESWHDKVRMGLQRLEGVEILEDGGLRYARDQTAKTGDKIKGEMIGSMDRSDPPTWVYQAAPGEPDPPRPLVPSRATQEEDNFPVLSPLEAGQGLRFLRGNLTHKLLQFLPSFELERRAQGARIYVETYGGDLTEEQRESIVCEVLALMTDPVTAPFFEACGLAEVPLTALLEGNRILSGQIDRLVVREDGVWILDYKTNRPPPPELSGVPRIYLKQMRAYRDAVKAIYPAKTVISALLWTDGPRLMILPDPELDKVI